jgi:hypothetical protein
MPLKIIIRRKKMYCCDEDGGDADEGALNGKHARVKHASFMNSQ